VRARTVVRAATAALLALAGTAGPAAATPIEVVVPETPEEPGTPAGGTEVTDAQFRWGINQESGNAAFAPGTVNLFSAGRMVSTGPDQTVTEERWAATDGAVRIEKRRPDGSFALATFAGTATTPTGQPLTSATAGLYSQHQVVIDGGSGTVDVAAGTATIAWDGEFTAIFYSGLTFFYVADPVLTVADGHGQVRATVGGYATDRADPTRWEPLPDTEVVLAELGAVELTEQGFTATPDYLGVAYDPPAGSEVVAQLREGGTWGAFPSSFVDFQLAVGQAPFWYSSGSSTDRFKVPLPLTVSVDASDPVEPPAEPPPAATPPVPVNPVVEPPPASTPPDPPPAAVAPPAAAAPPAATPPPTSAPQEATAEWQAFPATVQAARRHDLTALVPAGAPTDASWWVGGGLLLGAAVVVGLSASGRLVLGRRT
jgi:hypothetical protein